VRFFERGDEREKEERAKRRERMFGSKDGLGFFFGD
jgi:hypothetical protein